MGRNSPEIDCNCERLGKEYQDKRGYTFQNCIECGRVYRLVANDPDDYEWEIDWNKTYENQQKES